MRKAAAAGGEARPLGGLGHCLWLNRVPQFAFNDKSPNSHFEDPRSGRLRPFYERKEGSRIPPMIREASRL